MMPSLRIVDLSNTNIKGFLQQLGTHLHSALSLTALQNLKHLERLNLEHTQIRDEALYPLSTLQELRYISLRSTSLTDLSLHYLSSIPNLIDLSICDAVVTNYGLELFKPPLTVKMMDLRGCWLLSKDDILSFCGSHPPQIEVRHELPSIFPFDQNGPNNCSPSRLNSRTGQVSKKNGSSSMSPCFIGQRLKCSIDELLALQSLSLPLKHNNERGNTS